MEDSNRLGYFFLGLGVGVAAAMMFAPKSGAETRDYLQSKGQEAAGRLKQTGQDLRNQAVDSIDRGKQAVREQVNNLSAAVDAGTKAYKQAVDETSRA
jgi:gas vesicle protein